MALEWKALLINQYYSFILTQKITTGVECDGLLDFSCKLIEHPED